MSDFVDKNSTTEKVFNDNFDWGDPDFDPFSRGRFTTIQDNEMNQNLNVEFNNDFAEQEMNETGYNYHGQDETTNPNETSNPGNTQNAQIEVPSAVHGPTSPTQNGAYVYPPGNAVKSGESIGQMGDPHLYPEQSSELTFADYVDYRQLDDPSHLHTEQFDQNAEQFMGSAEQIGAPSIIHAPSAPMNAELQNPEHISLFEVSNAAPGHEFWIQEGAVIESSENGAIPNNYDERTENRQSQLEQSAYWTAANSTDFYQPDDSFNFDIEQYDQDAEQFVQSADQLGAPPTFFEFPSNDLAQRNGSNAHNAPNVPETSIPAQNPQCKMPNQKLRFRNPNGAPNDNSAQGASQGENHENFEHPNYQLQEEQSRLPKNSSTVGSTSFDTQMQDFMEPTEFLEEPSTVYLRPDRLVPRAELDARFAPSEAEKRILAQNPRRNMPKATIGLKFRVENGAATDDAYENGAIQGKNYEHNEHPYQQPEQNNEFQDAMSTPENSFNIRTQLGHQLQNDYVQSEEHPGSSSMVYNLQPNLRVHQTQFAPIAPEHQSFGAQQQARDRQKRKAPSNQVQHASGVKKPRKERCAHPAADNARPPLSYLTLCRFACLNLPDGNVEVPDVYTFIKHYFPFYRNEGKSWRSSVRHTLSTAAYFEKTPQAKNFVYSIKAPIAMESFFTKSEHYYVQQDRKRHTFLHQMVLGQVGFPETSFYSHFTNSELAGPENVALFDQLVNSGMNPEENLHLFKKYEDYPYPDVDPIANDEYY